MAFTGTATIKLVADGMTRITGLSLAAGAAGTIGFTGSTNSPNVTLPAQMEAGSYVAAGATVTLSDAVDIGSKLADTTAGAIAPVAITKTGSQKADFLATLTNQSQASATGSLEIYVKFHS
jgi:hypothetical protein